MIKVKLMGGLGNQMFQYAIGRKLALKHNTGLVLDISQLVNKGVIGDHTLRSFDLDAFRIEAMPASSGEARGWQKSKLEKVFHYLSFRLGLKWKGQYIREVGAGFKKEILDAPDDCYLDGYWQTEKYFFDVREQLLADFSLRDELSGENKRYAEEIRNCNSVSVHVRRGDYLTIAANKELFEVCSPEYYGQAMIRFAVNTADPVFYVFSDEPEWFRDNIKTDLPVKYVQGNAGKNSYIDMHLMSLCRHNIVANSSFSWWGAWLNRNEDKIVVAPAKWFKDKTMDTDDLVPEKWIKI